MLLTESGNVKKFLPLTKKSDSPETRQGPRKMEGHLEGPLLPFVLFSNYVIPVAMAFCVLIVQIFCTM